MNASHPWEGKYIKNPTTMYRFASMMSGILNTRAYNAKNQHYEKIEDMSKVLEVLKNQLYSEEREILNFITQDNCTLDSKEAYSRSQECVGICGIDYISTYNTKVREANIKRVNMVLSMIFDTPENNFDSDEIYNFIFLPMVHLYELKRYVIEQANEREEIDNRTCEQCKSTFPTSAGMHRHAPRCKGVYRGVILPKLKKDNSVW